MLKLAFLASRNGTSMQAILSAIAQGELAAEARLVVSNNRKAPALSAAAAAGVPTLWLPTKDAPETADAELAAALQRAEAELVILSGYLRRLGPRTLGAFPGRILNIHPGPLPAFGGEGMYGRRVHEAVIAAGLTETSAVIHVVDGEYDHGPAIACRSLTIRPEDTAETLESRMAAMEPQFYVETLRQIANGELSLPRI